MIWYVFRYNINSKTIEKYNIFEHGGFKHDCMQLLINITDKEKFIIELKNTLQYYFWCKCEYEIVISAWPPSHNDVQRKVDIFSQVMLNWNVFVDYVWNHRRQ